MRDGPPSPSSASVFPFSPDWFALGLLPSSLLTKEGRKLRRWKPPGPPPPPPLLFHLPPSYKFFLRCVIFRGCRGWLFCWMEEEEERPIPIRSDPRFILMFGGAHFSSCKKKKNKIPSTSSHGHVIAETSNFFFSHSRHFFLPSEVVFF